MIKYHTEKVPLYTFDLSTGGIEYRMHRPKEEQTKEHFQAAIRKLKKYLLENQNPAWGEWAILMNICNKHLSTKKRPCLSDLHIHALFMIENGEVGWDEKRQAIVTKANDVARDFFSTISRFWTSKKLGGYGSNAMNPKTKIKPQHFLACYDDGKLSYQLAQAIDRPRVICGGGASIERSEFEEVIREQYGTPLSDIWWYTLLRASRSLDLEYLIKKENELLYPLVKKTLGWLDSASVRKSFAENFTNEENLEVDKAKKILSKSLTKSSNSAASRHRRLGQAGWRAKFKK